MSEWIKVTNKHEVMPGLGKTVKVHDHVIALFQIDGEFYALDNNCPHRGGPLGEGDVEEGLVTCPWHGWQFDIKSGASPINPAACVKTYPVKVEGDDLFVEWES